MAERPPFLLLTGQAGSGKTCRLQAEYRRLMAAGARTDQVLVLVADAGQAHRWRQELALRVAGPLEVVSYFGFVQKELRLWWDRIHPQLPPGRAVAEPVLLNVETAHFLMRRLVDAAREKPGAPLAGVTAGPQRIAVLLASNLWTVAAANALAPEQIAARLAGARGGEDRPLYEQVQETVLAYREKLLGARVLDYGLALEVYHAYLLPDLVYRQHLFGRFRHLLVDDLDETVPRQHQFMGELLPLLETATLAFSLDGGHTQFMGARPQAAYAAFSRLCAEERLDGSYTAGPLCGALGDALAARIQGQRDARAPAGVRVERVEADLRGEMAAEVGRRMAGRIRAGTPAHAMAVVVPQVDKVVLHQLSEALAPVGCRVEDLSRTHRLLDDPYARALLAVVLLVHPEWWLAAPPGGPAAGGGGTEPAPRAAPGHGLLAGAFGVLLQLDPCRAALLATAAVRAGGLPDLDEAGLRRRLGFRSGELYDGLRGWVQQAREQQRPVDELVAAAAAELLAPLAEGPELVPSRQLVRSAQRMRTVAEGLAAVLQEPPGRCYVEMLLAGTIAADPLEPPGADPGAVPVATPFAWLGSRRGARIQIWLDVSGDQWYRSDVKELTNPHVLSPDWPPGDLWTDSRQLQSRRANAARTVRALLRRCGEELWVGESTLSSWGVEQEGGIAEALADVLGS